MIEIMGCNYCPIYITFVTKKKKPFTYVREYTAYHPESVLTWKAMFLFV